MSLNQPIPPRRVVLLRGPLAVGKSTVAQQLAQVLAPCAWISVDKLRKMPCDGDLSPRHLRLSKRNAALLACEFLAEGYSAVIESVFEDAAHVCMVMDRVASAGAAIHLVTLTASLSALQLRDREKAVPNAERVEELHQRLLRSDAPVGLLVDTTHLTVNEICQLIRARLDEGAGRQPIHPHNQSRHHAGRGRSGQVL